MNQLKSAPAIMTQGTLALEKLCQGGSRLENECLLLDADPQMINDVQNTYFSSGKFNWPSY